MRLTKSHLSKIIQAVLRGTFGFGGRWVDELAANDVQALELMEHGDSKTTMVLSKVDKTTTGRQYFLPLFCAHRGVKRVAMGILGIQINFSEGDRPFMRIVVSYICYLKVRTVSSSREWYERNVSYATVSMTKESLLEQDKIEDEEHDPYEHEYGVGDKGDSGHDSDELDDDGGRLWIPRKADVERRKRFLSNSRFL